MDAYPSEVAPLSKLNLLISANRDILERARTQVSNLAIAENAAPSSIDRFAPGQLAES
jgi:hypothetical protein